MSFMKKTVDPDTTIPSYLFDERESIREYIAVTKKWWDEESKHFDVYVSEETIAELSEGDYPQSARDIGVRGTTPGLATLIEDILEIACVLILDTYLMPQYQG